MYALVRACCRSLAAATSRVQLTSFLTQHPFWCTGSAPAQLAQAIELLKAEGWLILRNGLCYLCTGRDHTFDACEVYLGWPREQQVQPSRVPSSGLPLGWPASGISLLLATQASLPASRNYSKPGAERCEGLASMSQRLCAAWSRAEQESCATSMC